MWWEYSPSMELLTLVTCGILFDCLFFESFLRANLVQRWAKYQHYLSQASVWGLSDVTRNPHRFGLQTSTCPWVSDDQRMCVTWIVILPALLIQKVSHWNNMNFIYWCLYVQSGKFCSGEQAVFVIPYPCVRHKSVYVCRHDTFLPSSPQISNTNSPTLPPNSYVWDFFLQLTLNVFYSVELVVLAVAQA